MGERFLPNQIVNLCVNSIHLWETSGKVGGTIQRLITEGCRLRPHAREPPFQAIELKPDDMIGTLNRAMTTEVVELL